MDEQLKSTLEKAILPILLLFGAYLGWDYYTFTTDPSSPLLQKQQEVASMQQETSQVREKLKKAQDFYRTLEQRSVDLRQLALQLEEANKVGMAVQGLKPTDSHEEEYYVQQSFELKFHGVFVQLAVFLERLSN